MYIETLEPYTMMIATTLTATMRSRRHTAMLLLALLSLSTAFAFTSNNHAVARYHYNTIIQQQHRPTTKLYSTPPPSDKKAPTGIIKSLAPSLSQTANLSSTQQYRKVTTPAEQKKIQLLTLVRIALPSILIGVLATLTFPAMALTLATWISKGSGTATAAGVFSVLSQDSSQFVQNFLTVAGLLFSILVGQTYYFMYQQQESIYYALFNEVTEAKSLLEQIALVCQGRSMYPQCLSSMNKYVQNDLKMLQAPPAVLLSSRPVDDPLEAIMYLTSVGVPSTVYETVRSLRQARAARLGALQRKLPAAHMGLLWILALIELVSFPLLGAGTQTIGGYNILTVEGVLFGVMTSGIVLTLRVVGELWRPAGGAYNVDQVLSVMVSGLETELQARLAGGKVGKKSSQLQQNDDLFPSGVQAKAIKQQGPNVVDAAQRIWRWSRRSK